MIVLRVVNRGNLLRGQGTSEENGIDSVTQDTLIVGQDDESAVGVEFGIVEQRGDPVASPLSTVGKASIVAVIVYSGKHVGLAN